MVTDTISDMFTRIRNASLISQHMVQIPKTKITSEIARILKEEGWIIKNDLLTNQKTGQIFEFEILLRSQLFERIVLPMKRNLEKLGIIMRIRTVQDDSQYQKRLENDCSLIEHYVPKGQVPIVKIPLI